ncbi:hypothetical protein DFH07DRAFT_1057984 [Mycena maculata]|uniref:Uncharacterized protein n=1 Tax=Mycena maculata TaxID=230809 RepID=A0AAD7NQ79_9AGAR|nr:hypothetical protein DFH07DRAFT_1057984 [Mycena maculata]
MSDDYHGDDWPLRVPKYWDDEEQEVVYSTKPREEPIQLKEILGYYSWIFNAYEEEDKEVEPGSHGYLELEVDKTKAKTTAKGKGKKKGKKKSAPVEDLDLAHVVGSFDTCGINSQFIGLEDGDGECTWVFDKKHLVEKAEEDKNYYDEQCDFADSDFSISVVDILDDNGHPFVEFTHSPGMHDYDVTYVGKKQKAKHARGTELEGLTDGERQRLGIFVEEAEIKRAALEGRPPALESGAADNHDEVDEGGPSGTDKSGTSRKRKAEEDEEAEEGRPFKK